MSDVDKHADKIRDVQIRQVREQVIELTSVVIQMQTVLVAVSSSTSSYEAVRPQVVEMFKRTDTLMKSLKVWVEE